MQIEVQGPEYLLKDLALILGDLLQEAGYAPGPRLGTMHSGNVTTFVKQQTIVTVQVQEESEQEMSTLCIETEVEIPELSGLWDLSLIRLGKKINNLLLDYSVNRENVKQGIG